MVACPFCPSWAAVGEEVTAGYAAFFFSLYGTQRSVLAPPKARLDADGQQPSAFFGVFIRCLTSEDASSIDCL